MGSLSRNCIFLTTNAQLLFFTTRSKLNKNKISNLSKVAVFLTVLYTKEVYCTVYFLAALQISEPLLLQYGSHVSGISHSLEKIYSTACKKYVKIIIFYT